MSNEQSKVKSSSRRYRTENAIQRQVKIAKQHGFEHNDDLIKQPHRLAKHHAMDCGNPECAICGNPRKNKTIKAKDKLTMQERRMFQDPDNQPHRHSNGVDNKE